MQRKRLQRNEGQALVEFALVIPLFLIVVVGVLQFGRAITYWLDLNDSSHTAVRYAVTNRFPGCDSSTSTACGSGGSLAEFATFATGNLNSTGLKNSTTLEICYVDANNNDDPSLGEPVRVAMTSPFNYLGLLEITLNLRGRGTMRMEQTISANNPSRIGDIPTC